MSRSVNLLDPDQFEALVAEELTYREKQLIRLRDEVIDLEEMDDNVSLSEFTLDDFRVELMNFLASNPRYSAIFMIGTSYSIFGPVPYAAPGSRSENLCKGIIRAGKQILTFGDAANESLLAMGAKPIKVEDLKKQFSVSP